MALLDDLWASGDKDAVLQRVMPLLYEAPVLFGGTEGMRKPFLAEAVRAWDANELLPRGKAARPVEAALLVALRDLYVRWVSKLSVAAPDPGDEKLNVTAVLEGLKPEDSAVLKLVQAGLRFLAPEEIRALAAAADKSVAEVVAGLSKAEEARRASGPDRAKALDKFALARSTGAEAEGLAAWAVQAREGASLTTADIDEGVGWPQGAAARKLAAARETIIAKLTSGRRA